MALSSVRFLRNFLLLSVHNEGNIFPILQKKDLFLTVTEYVQNQKIQHLK